MTTTVIAYRSAELAWSVSEAEDQRYRQILKRTLQVLLALAILLTLLPIPKLDREKVEELPPRLAKLLLERTPPPPPVAKAPEPETKKPDAKKPEVKKKEEPKKQTAEAARAKAERSGLLAFKDELADLRTVNTGKLDKPELAKGPALAPGPAGRGAERALITSNAARGSGGISTSRLSRDTGGGGLGERSTGSVSSPVGGGGGDGKYTRGGSGKAGRPLEELKLVFDRNKGSIYNIYNRALRSDPSLQGKVVFKLTIAPSGKVLDIAVVSSELRNPELERKLLARIKQFDFGAKDVDTLIVTYPVDFLPS
jgi:TonB family protein